MRTSEVRRRQAAVQARSSKCWLTVCGCLDAALASVRPCWLTPRGRMGKRGLCPLDREYAPLSCYRRILLRSVHDDRPSARSQEWTQVRSLPCSSTSTALATPVGWYDATRDLRARKAGPRRLAPGPPGPHQILVDTSIRRLQATHARRRRGIRRRGSFLERIYIRGGPGDGQETKKKKKEKGRETQKGRGRSKCSGRATSDERRAEGKGRDGHG